MTAPKISIRRPKDALILDLGDASYWMVLRGRDLGNRAALARLVMQPGAQSWVFCHAREDKIFHVLEGDVLFQFIEDGRPQDVALGPGDTLLVPRGVIHCGRNLGDHPAVGYVAYTPAGFDGVLTRVAQSSTKQVWATLAAHDVAVLMSLDPDFQHPALDAPPAPVRLLRRADGEGYVLAGDLYRMKVTSAQTDGLISLTHVTVPPGGGPPPHVHSWEEEVFVVLDGTVSLYADGQRPHAGPGTVICLPRDIPHGFHNMTDAPVEMLCLMSPAGGEALFAQAGRPAPREAGLTLPVAEAVAQAGPPTDPKALRTIAERLGVRLLADIPAPYTAPPAG